MKYYISAVLMSTLIGCSASDRAYVITPHSLPEAHTWLKNIPLRMLEVEYITVYVPEVDHQEFTLHHKLPTRDQLGYAVLEHFKGETPSSQEHLIVPHPSSNVCALFGGIIVHLPQQKPLIRWPNHITENQNNGDAISRIATNLSCWLYILLPHSVEWLWAVTGVKKYIHQKAFDRYIAFIKRHLPYCGTERIKVIIHALIASDLYDPHIIGSHYQTAQGLLASTYVATREARGDVRSFKLLHQEFLEMCKEAQIACGKLLPDKKEPQDSADSQPFLPFH